MQSKILIEGIKFAEGLRWRDGRFWYSDFYKHQVFSVGSDHSPRLEATLDDQPSGLGWLPDGRLLMVAMLGQKLMRRERDGRIVQHANLSGLALGHANDMVVDLRGRAYIGFIGFDLDAFVESKGVEALFAEPGPPRTSVIMVDENGVVRIAASDMRFPNGMTILNDQLIVAESLGSGLIAFDRLPDGTLVNPTRWASFRRDRGIVTPDGICADRDGGIWLANANVPEVLRVTKGGNIQSRVATSQVAFSCALGGVDGRDLLIATAPTPSAATLSAHLFGKLEIARVDIPVV